MAHTLVCGLFFLKHRLSYLLVEFLRCSVRVSSLWLDQNSLHGKTSESRKQALSSSSQLASHSLALCIHGTSVGQRSSGNPNRNRSFLPPPLLLYLPRKLGGVQAGEVPMRRSWEKTPKMYSLPLYSYVISAAFLISPQFQYLQNGNNSNT